MELNFSDKVNNAQGSAVREILKIIAAALPVYKTKFEQMAAALKKYMPPTFSINHTTGGLFIWGKFSSDINTKTALKKAIENNIAYVCGSDFFADGGNFNTLRLNFTNATEQQIETGVKRLSNIFSEEQN